MKQRNITTISELCLRVMSGGTPSRSNPEYWEGGTIPWMKTGEISQGFIYGTEENITERGFENSAAKMIPKHSVIVALYGDGYTAGSVAITKIDLTTNQACCNLIVDPKKCHYAFLYYYLKGSYNNLVSLKSGGSQQNLNALTVRSFPILCRDLSAQRKIAAILSAYDELIENNKRRIVLLEKMAEEIYREWFVRLRFPGHEKVKVANGVPEGWEVKKLGSVLDLLYGKALKDDARIPGEFPVYGSSGVVGTHHEALVKTSGLIVGRKGNVGSVYWSDSGFFPIDTVYFVKSELPDAFLYFLLRSMNFINNDAAVPGLNRSQAYSNLLFLPPAPLINKYTEAVDSQFEMKRLLTRQNEKLVATRDCLLPRLISGKLSVENLDIQFPPGMAEELNPESTAAIHA